MKKIHVLAGGVIWALTVGSSAYAAEVPAQSLTLSPVKQQISIKAGDTYRGSFQLYNTGRATYDLKVYAKPYWVKDEHYTADFETKKPNTDFYEWVKFSQTNYHLKSNDTITVNYEVNVPSDARPGGHYGVLFAETVPVKGQANFGVSSTQRLGMLAFGRVEGSVKEEVRIKSQEVALFQFTKPLKTATRFENSGNVDFSAKVDMTVKNVLGAKKHTSQKDFVILPGTVRNVDMSWDQPALFGLYEVELSSKYLDTGNTKTSYVFMAPVWFYLVVPLVVLALLVYGIQKKRS